MDGRTNQLQEVGGQASSNTVHFQSQLTLLIIMVREGIRNVNLESDVPVGKLGVQWDDNAPEQILLDLNETVN